MGSKNLAILSIGDDLFGDKEEAAEAVGVRTELRATRA
jgi:hypothetical protein